ncbi:hypothetical protein Poli38472_006465 [Pythium oligandrum]|uniref:Endonuclease III homolog n=1 Tax=Pythium oligandrum TaxID=41045 RepID=A0A8K1C4U4_PYTOL|nr:hypothetical protein Poli38472_006465 [Pythium oligandrum]|eukprot:TMW56455.1 hypothetical protein Poli38472_006465 [Pythium oligandrum]
MQLRSRVRLSSTLEVSVATETAVLKRQSPKTTSSSKEKEVRNGRNATRKRPATTMSTGDDVVQKAKLPKKCTIGRNKDGTPEHWQTVMEGIQEMRAAQVADVDVAGIEVFYDEEAYPPHIARFRVLISAMLSSQTKDPVNAAAMKRLTTHGLTVQSMLEVDEAELAQIIRPVGFFNNKAKYIKQVAQILKDRAGEDNEVIDIPNTYDDLVALPGVGPKMAHLIMSCAWKTTVGICVDTHVHRISNRLGWVKTWNTKNPKSQDPEKTRLELEDWLPREHWNPINVLLVGFGQTICLPRGPKCDECKVAHLCPSAHSSAI